MGLARGPALALVAPSRLSTRWAPEGRHGEEWQVMIGPGALLVGLADNFGKALFPEISYFTLYAPMALILAIKPTGLFGRD